MTGFRAWRYSCTCVCMCAPTNVMHSLFCRVAFPGALLTCGLPAANLVLKQPAPFALDVPRPPSRFSLSVRTFMTVRLPPSRPGHGWANPITLRRAISRRRRISSDTSPEYVSLAFFLVVPRSRTPNLANSEGVVAMPLRNAALTQH